MKNKKESSKPFKIFGLGQCGTKLAQEFEYFGMDACYINSDAEDVKGLKSSNVLQVETSGTGGDPSKGYAMIEANKKKFLEFVKANASEHQINLVIAGAGGGTGGGIVTPTARALKEMGYKTGCLLTLPLKSLNILACENSIKTLKALKNIELDYFVMADNEYLVNKVGISELWWNNVNKYIVNTIMLPFTIISNSKSSSSGFGSIDKGEINRVLQYGNGLIDIRSVMFTKDEIKKLSDKELKAAIFAPGLVEKYDYSNSLAYMVCVNTPDKGNYNDFANRVLTITQKMAGSAVSRVGTFTDSTLKDTVEVIIINAGLKLPKVLMSRVNNLKRDAQRYLDKKGKADPTILDYDDSVISSNFSLD